METRPLLMTGQNSSSTLFLKIFSSIKMVLKKFSTTKSQFKHRGCTEIDILWISPYKTQANTSLQISSLLKTTP